jgi:hypothetical protein
MKSQHRDALLVVTLFVEGKSNMVIKFVPFEKEQSSQIEILEELAISD